MPKKRRPLGKATCRDKSHLLSPLLSTYYPTPVLGSSEDNPKDVDCGRLKIAKRLDDTCCGHFGIF